MRRRIQANETTRTPGAVICLDTETTEVPISQVPGRNCHLFRLGCAAYWRYEAGQVTREERVDFTDRLAMWQWIIGRLDKVRPTWLFAHNLGFDLTTLRFWELLESRTFVLRDSTAAAEEPGPDGKPKRGWMGLLVTDDYPTMVYVKHRDGALLKCMDTLNWVPLSLREIGDWLDSPKSDRPGEVAGDEDWLDYCRRDLEILVRLVRYLISFVENNDLGVWQPTAAAQAMRMYRHRCITTPIDLDSRPEHKVLEREAFYGGRKQVYFQGTCLPLESASLEKLAACGRAGPYRPCRGVSHLDVVGCYPSVMREHLYPIRYLRTQHEVTPKRLDEYLQGLGAVAEVRIQSRDVPYPLRRPEGTLWAVGSFCTTLCGPDLRQALRLGHIASVGRVNLYSESVPFTKFVDDIWGIRLLCKAKGDTVGARLAKLIANSLHGKFGQRASRWELVRGLPLGIPWGMTWVHGEKGHPDGHYRSIGGDTQYLSGRVEHEDSFPAVAAYTTAYARHLMWHYREVATPQDTLYEDADSIHVTGDGLDRLHQAGLVQEDTLGALRIEAQADLVTYFGPKHYLFGDRLVCAGLSPKAKRDGRGLWCQTNFHHLDSYLKDLPPVGPITEEVTVATPDPVIRGRISVEGNVSWPVIED